jgi:hypothetical protein
LLLKTGNASKINNLVIIELKPLVTFLTFKQQKINYHRSERYDGNIVPALFLAALLGELAAFLLGELAAF